MSLTLKDLTKIRSAIKEEVKDVLKDYVNIRAFNELKKTVYNIEDIVLGIRNELDTEHEIRLFQIDNNTKQLEDHEVRIQTLEKSKTA
jgi:hypothetical protein